MPKPSSGDRSQRRQSSGSRSSLATVRPLEQSTSPSRSEVGPAWNGYNALLEAPSLPQQKRTRSSSAKRSSGSAHRKADARPDQGHDPAHSHKWSHSSSSTNSKDHKRRSSLSTRPGLSPSSFGTMTGMNRRTPSPSKKRRPADIAVRSAGPGSGGGRAATLAPTDMLPQGGTFYTLESPMFATERTADPPRTPLLHEGQIMGADANTSYRPEEQETYTAPKDWVPPVPREQARPGTANLASRDLGTSGPVVANDSGQSDSSEAAQMPEMEQKHRYGSSNTEDMQMRVDSQYDNASADQSRTSPRKRGKSSRDSDRTHRKTMLASALQRATEAVQLDNEQDYPAALIAYTEACEYLEQVALNSSADEDKRKLGDIRVQYTVRVREIMALKEESESSQVDNGQAASGAEQLIARSVAPVSDGSLSSDTRAVHGTVRDAESKTFRHAAPGASDWQDSSNSLSLPQPDDITIAPLSPRRPPPQPPTNDPTDLAPDPVSDSSAARESRILDTQVVTPLSWLDGAEEPLGSSPPSSHHSMSSVNQVRRKHLRVRSTSTEADFDAALDAAVEAAYDQGYEPFDGEDESSSAASHSQSSRHGSSSTNDAYLAGRADRLLAHTRNKSNRQQQTRETKLPRDTSLQHQDSEVDSDEEAEKILDQVHDSSFTSTSRSPETQKNPPRQSDSSSSSGGTWGSSATSSLLTAGTCLSTVDENALPLRSKQPLEFSHGPAAPPPTSALPLPPKRSSGIQNFSQSAAKQSRPPLNVTHGSSLQDRRLSGRKGKSLKIETAVGHANDQILSPKGRSMNSDKRPDLQVPLDPPRAASGAIASSPEAAAGAPNFESQNTQLKAASANRQISSPFPTPFQATFSDFSESSTISPSDTNLTSAVSNDSSFRPSPYPASPGDPFSKHLNQRVLTRNDGSSLSLRNQGLLTPGSDTDYRSPATPLSSTFSPMSPANIADSLDDGNGQAPRAKPRNLEPCPELQILRPYWLMRCIAQTVSHQDGGFLTTKLCIPRKVWLATNVKLKHVEDKVACCDLLTAALHKLGRIDTLDADAMLEEMDSFESVMTQVQSSLSKKLGNEIGSQNISTLFKEAPAGVTSLVDGARHDQSGDTAGNTVSTGSGKSSSRGYFSLRRLRNKPSDAAMAKSYTSVKDSQGMDGPKVSTVPMTPSLQALSARTAKRDGRPISPGADIKPEGPNANYMSSLARLCDAAQVLDQIARQVEDPGLKHSSPTYVGLELNSKHASDFFALYVCRFVLQDITTLAEKHVKRASEYVLN